MSPPVNGFVDRQATRRAETEQRICDAAARLFLRDGWTGTTLSAVAREAGVADRTVYVRFGTKADLLKRTIDVALVGDVLPIPLIDREWARRSATAPTLAERVALLAAGSAQIVQRIAPLIGVALEAVSEPVIAGAAQAGRRATVAQVRAWWEQLAADGMLDPAVDLEYLIVTSATLMHAETYLLMSRSLDWNVAKHETWLARTILRLVGDSARSESP